MNIIFDIDDTLFPSSEFSALARKNALNAIISMGLRKSYYELDNTLSNIITEKGSNYEHHFDELLKDTASTSKYVAAAIAAYHDTKASIAPYPDVPLTLLELKKNNKIYVATNGKSIKQWDKLIRLRLALFFDDVFISEDLGCEKSVKFYEEIIKRLKSSPKDCIMIGDKEQSDIIPSKKLGLITFRMRKGKDLDSPTVADYSITNISELIQIVKNF